MKSKSVALNDFHGLDLLKAGFFGDFIFSGVGIVFKVAGIGNIPYIAHLIAQML